MLCVNLLGESTKSWNRIGDRLCTLAYARITTVAILNHVLAESYSQLPVTDKVLIPKAKIENIRQQILSSLFITQMVQMN